MDIPDGIGCHGDEKLGCHSYEDMTEIDYVREPLAYPEFFSRYLLPNRPCVLGRWATRGWRSRVEWVRDGRPDLQYLEREFGDVVGPAANCGETEFCAHPKQEQTVREYINYLRKYRESDYSADMPCLYLKDWHFTRLFPDYTAYTTPVYFHSDWLNEFWDSREDEEDDYRFVYIGPKGSWTPFHADVFRSYSWSANICGEKKWIIFPPGEEENLKDKFGTLVYDVRSAELNEHPDSVRVKHPDSAHVKHPDSAHVKYPNSVRIKQRFEVTQREGEVIFVPSGWHHQVHNMEDTISINHNWINGCNIELCWKYIKQTLKDVQGEVEDCRDMEGWDQQCQRILKASSGIDYTEFYLFIHTIATTRLEFLEKQRQKLTEGGACKVMERSGEAETEVTQDREITGRRLTGGLSSDADTCAQELLSAEMDGMEISAKQSEVAKVRREEYTAEGGGSVVTNSRTGLCAQSLETVEKQTGLVAQNQEIGTYTKLGSDTVDNCAKSVDCSEIVEKQRKLTGHETGPYTTVVDGRDANLSKVTAENLETVQYTNLGSDTGDSCAKFVDSTTEEVAPVSKCAKVSTQYTKVNSQCGEVTSQYTEVTSQCTEVTSQCAKVTCQPYYLTVNHALFDLSRIRQVAQDMAQDPEFIQLDYSALPEEPNDFVSRIDKMLAQFD